MRSSAKILQKLQWEFKDGFKGIGCFDGMFSLLDKDDSKPYLVSLMHMAYALQNPFMEELAQLKQQDIFKHLGVDETAE